jgi:hypothetical protein
MSHRRQSFCFILSLPLLSSKGPCHARETDKNRPQLSRAFTAPRLRALQRAEHIGSALKGRDTLSAWLEWQPSRSHLGCQTHQTYCFAHLHSRPHRSWVGCCAQQVQSFDLDQKFWCRDIDEGMRWLDDGADAVVVSIAEPVEFGLKAKSD